MEGIRKAMNERNLNEGQWEDRKQWIYMPACVYQVISRMSYPYTNAV
jgi:hypothetical protein